MTITLSIKSVPDELAAQLRERAARNHRSLQGELMAIIESAVRASHGDAGMRATAVGLDERGRPIVRKGTRRIEDIAAELRRLTPEPRVDVPRAVDIIRAMRDSR